MNKTDEELNQAEKMAKRHGVRMCDENGETHGEELYCVGIDDIADIIREALAEQEKQEPVGEVARYEGKGNLTVYADYLPTGTKIYAAPVDAKTIRAEALEEAAKWFEDEEHPLQPKKVAAAIRGIK